MNKSNIIMIFMALATILLITGCASNASKRRVGIGISKTPGQKAQINVSAGRTVGKHGRGHLGVSTKVK